MQVPSYQELEVENAELRSQVASLSRENAELKAALKLTQKKFLEVSDALVKLTERHESETTQLKERMLELETELLKSQRAAKRQAAPHRRRKRIPKGQQKKSGRPKGHVPAFRRPPPSDEVDETIHVLLQHCCPDCGLELDEFQRHVHHVVDVPQIPEPTVRRYVTHSGRCRSCNTRWNSDHPDLPSLATGAAGTTLGHNAVALAGQMRTRLGVPYRKLAEFFTEILGLPVSPAGLLGALDRASRALEPSYRSIQTALQSSEVICVDETGWYLENKSAWAWVFTNYRYTMYVISRSRGHGIPLEVLGEDFAGHLLTDFFSAYDPLPYEKAKCLGHLIRALADVEKLQTRGAVRFPRAALAVLRDAMELKDRKDELPAEAYGEGIEAIRARLDRLLGMNITEEKNLRLAKRMRKHREHLLTFLEHDAVDATNNQAERQIRPLVLQRKVSAGNRSERGAWTHSILSSVMATCYQQGLKFVDVIAGALSGNVAELFQLPRPPT